MIRRKNGFKKEVNKIRAKNVKEVLKTSLDSGSVVGQELGSIFLWGQPGVGKSQTIAEVARENQAGCIDFRLILCDPTDLRGLPFPIKDANGVERCIWITPDELPRENDLRFPSRGFLFFDDFVTAPPLTQAAAFQITISPHQLGPYRLPTGWVVVAAGNRMEDRSGAHRMPKALSNRFIHIDYEVNVDDWVDWALANNIDSKIISFIKFKPSLLHAFNPNSSEEAFATPRTWEMVNRQMGIFGKWVSDEVVEGTVGKGAAAEFKAFMVLQSELPNIDRIFAGENYVPEKVSLKYAVVSALATRPKPNQYDRLLEYSNYLPDEFAVLLLKMLVSRDGSTVSKCPTLPAWVKTHAEVIF